MVTSVELLNQSVSSYSVNANKQSKVTTEEADSGQVSTVSAMNQDTLELSVSTLSSTVYSKTESKGVDASTLAEIQEQVDQSTENLRSLVEKLILKQTKNAGLASLYGKNVTETNTTAVEQASQSISEDGEYGVKAVSDRIVEFAKTISGGDTAKLEELKEAIKEGFEQAGVEWGGELPSISQQTYDEVMRKLDEWAGVKTEDTASV